MAGRDLSAELFGTGRDLSEELFGKKERTIPETVGGAIVNAPRSALNFLGGLVGAVAHPIDTVGGLMDIGAGALRNLAPESVRAAIDRMDAGESRFAAERASQAARDAADFYKNRYGSAKQIKETIATDPVGVAGDLTMILQGGAGLARAASKVPALSKAGTVADALNIAATKANPLSPLVSGTEYLVNKAAPYVKSNPGGLLTEALQATPEDVQKIVKAANAAPESIVPGSNLTLSQALAQQGVKNPNVALLEQVAAEGPGGQTLRSRYADQAAARKEALGKAGAETYQGAAADISERTGNSIASILRTQAADDAALARDMWQGPGGVYSQAADEGVKLNLPFDEMVKAMSPLGRGTAVNAKGAHALMSEAEKIGFLELPAVKQTKAPKQPGQTLEQAVRAAGGIRGKGGELRALGIRQSGTTGLINNKSGRPADLLAEEMHQRGFLPDADEATLYEALRNGGGRKVYAHDMPDDGYSRMSEASMGDLPEATKVAQAVPFDEFQRLRRDARILAENATVRGSPTEAGVLQHIRGLLVNAADEAVASPDATMSQTFLDKYNAARDVTRRNAELYKGGDNVAQILRKPFGQNYTLSGNEVTNKLWHGGQGLVGDVRSLKNVLSEDNARPTLDSLRRHVLTEAASKTNTSGELGAAFPKYVESRLPGMQELLYPHQLEAVTNVAADIRNADAGARVSGLRNSATYAKMSNALDAGVLDSPIAKSVAKGLSLKGIGGETLRTKLADMVKENKGAVLADLFANPKKAAAALQDAEFTNLLDRKTLTKLRATAKLAPVLNYANTQSSN